MELSVFSKVNKPLCPDIVHLTEAVIQLIVSLFSPVTSPLFIPLHFDTNVLSPRAQYRKKKCISAIYVSKKQLVNVARFAEKVPENCKSCQQWERLWIIHNPRASNSHPYSGYLTTLIQHGLVNFSTPHPPPPHENGSSAPSLSSF